MNCYDCATDGRAELAVGTCLNCGAAVCRRHVQEGRQDVGYGSLGPRVEEATRRLRCTSCDRVLANGQQEEAPKQEKRSLADLASSTKEALAKQGAVLVERTRPAAKTSKTRQELYDEAQRRDVKGRSKMSRDELARALGHN